MYSVTSTGNSRLCQYKFNKKKLIATYINYTTKRSAPWPLRGHRDRLAPKRGGNPYTFSVLAPQMGGGGSSIKNIIFVFPNFRMK